MIVLNITINVAEKKADEWMEWMKAEHIPNILSSNCFTSHKMLRLLNERADADGPTFALQLFAKEMKDVSTFAVQYDSKLEQIVQQKFGTDVLSFRTLLEEI